MKTAEHPPITIESPRKRRRWGRVSVKGFLILMITLLLFSGVFYVYANEKWNNRKIPIDELSWAPLDGPLNILVIGSDSREGLSPEDLRKRQFKSSSGRRSDTIILIHLFGDGKHAVVMSFPRDLRVDVPGYGLTKINAAYNDGPEKVVKTVENYTGLSVNHYVEVNFAAFKNIVEALGGVDICATQPYVDKKAGLNIRKPGCYKFDGDMALSWARSRSVEPDGDFGRIRRQQQLIRVMLQKATSKGILWNPKKALDVVNSVSAGLVIDDRFDLTKARGLAVRLRNAKESNKNVEFRMVPSFPKMIGGTSYVIAKMSEASAMFAAIKADDWTKLPPFGKTAFSIPDPKDVTVRIIDASGKAGLGAAMKKRLMELGFDVLTTVRTAPVQSATQIWYRPGDELKVELVRKYLQSSAEVNPQADPKAEVTLVLGADAVLPSPSPSPVAS